MVMMAEPVVSAIRSCKKEGSRVIYLSPRGVPLTPKIAKELSAANHLIFLSGHYEGIDERAIESEVDLEVSIGDYVLTNGCLAALVLIDVVSRFIPGVLGHEEGASSDSFENGLLEHSQYTTPRIFEGKEVPDILFSGDHKKISLWQDAEALRKTYERRPSLVANVFAEREGKESSSALKKIVMPTAFFDTTCSFYRKLTGITPDIENGCATFSWAGCSLSFMASNEIVSSQELLYLELPFEQLKKAHGWWQEKHADKERLQDCFLCKDPDGRAVVLYSKTN